MVGIAVGEIKSLDVRAQLNLSLPPTRPIRETQLASRASGDNRCSVQFMRRILSSGEGLDLEWTWLLIASALLQHAALT